MLAFCKETLTSSSSLFETFQLAGRVLPVSSLTITSLTQHTPADCRCRVSSRPTISALASFEASAHGPGREARRRKRGPSKERNPQVPRRVPIISPSMSFDCIAAVSTINPPSADAALAGRSTMTDLDSTWRTKLCASSVAKTSGAPSTVKTSEGLFRHKTWVASTARSGGRGVDRTGGNPITNTDFGLRNEGGLLRRKLS